VHGCFWHQHRGCIDGRIPKSRMDYWEPKLRGNVERDRRNVSKLRRKGWRVLRVWECEVAKIERIRERLTRFLEKAAQPARK